MSTLDVNTIRDASAGNPMLVSDINQGRAKSWINLNGTGTIALRDSFNISGVVDNGTGNYTANLSAALANSNFTTPASADAAGICIASASAGSVSSFGIRSSSGGAPSTLADVTFLLSSAFGDL